MMPPILEVVALRVCGPDGRPVLDGVQLRVRAGQRVGIIGESGAGKTTLALAALGILRPGLRRTAGAVHLVGHDVLALPERARRRLRRTHTGWLGQDPAAALTPTLPVAAQVRELLAPANRDTTAIARRLTAVGLPADEQFARRLPPELSGGQQQRLALARALAGTPELLVLDEPTSRLDPVTRALVTGELDRLQHEHGFAVLLISHDLDLVARICDDVLVLHEGRQVEAGTCQSVLRSPAHAHTHRLRDAYPDPQRATPASPQAPEPGRPAPPVLQLRGLCAGHRDQQILHDIDLTLAPGEVLALVGASGSGKTTLARCLTGLHRPSQGRLHIDGRSVPAHAEHRSRDQRGLVQLIGQDPAGSLHPRRRAEASVARPLRLLQRLPRAQARARARDHLAAVGLAPNLWQRLPHELSGGERQRVAIARALAAVPKVLICDEITSALDATVATDVLGLLARLRRERGLSILFISHDLALAAGFADRLAVLDRGRIVEQAPIDTVLARPTSAAAAALIAATPSLTATLAAGTAAMLAAAARPGGPTAAPADPQAEPA